MRLPWMSRSERRLWRSATTLPELGELMAQWLEGELDSRPGYPPRVGPDEETSELVPALAAICAAGYVAVGFQSGCEPEVGGDGLLWQQRAFVEGFVDDPQLLHRLVEAAEQAGLLAVVHDPQRPRNGSVIVTLRGGHPHAWAGSTIEPGDVDLMWGGCNKTARHAIDQAAQLTLIDLNFTWHTPLWDALNRVADDCETADPAG